MPVPPPRRRLRLFCALLALGILLPVDGAVRAARDPGVPEDLGRFTVARLRYPGGGDWYADPSSLPNLLDELQRRTGLPTTSDEVVVTLDDERLFAHPFLYATGHGTMALDEDGLERLRRYLDAGGFLWVDDNYGIDDSFRATMAELFPEDPLVPLASDHPIYSAWYRLPGLPKIHEHDGDPAQGYGLFRGGRMAVYYSWSSDIGDGLEDASVHGDPPQTREAAMKMAINVCMYALTQP